MAARLKKEDEAWLDQPPSPFALPLLLGAALLVGADMIARVIITPAELPIGIVTAVLGAPVFLWILLRQRGVVDL